MSLVDSSALLWWMDTKSKHVEDLLKRGEADLSMFSFRVLFLHVIRDGLDPEPLIQDLLTLGFNLHPVTAEHVRLSDGPNPGAGDAELRMLLVQARELNTSITTCDYTAEEVAHEEFGAEDVEINLIEFGLEGWGGGEAP